MSDHLDPYIPEELPQGKATVEVKRPGRPRVFRKEYRSTIEQDSGRASQPLFNVDDVPDYIANNFKAEKPEHRVIGFLKSQGLSNVEIAERTGYAPLTVGKICRLPFIRDLILEEIRRSGRDAVQEVLSSAALDSVMKLIEVRDSGPIPEQRKAANDLLDRVYGKPNQPVTHTKQVDLNELSDKELAEIVKKENN